MGTPGTLFANPAGTGVRFGSLGRNVFRGPWFNGLDTNLNSGTFGRAQILVGSAPARRIQLGARIQF